MRERGWTLVTGGAGYVGSVVVGELLRRGRRVRILDSLRHGQASLLHLWGSPNLAFVRADVRDAEATANALEGVDEVVHLAAIVGDPACAREPDVARAVNYEAPVRLVKQSLSAGVRRFVLASTCSNYGRISEDGVFATEEWPLRPVSLYAETKVAAELAVLAQNSASFTSSCLRFATVYGTAPRMRFDLTVNEFTRDAYLKRELVVFGERFWRPYIHVRDAAEAIALVLDAPHERVAGRVFNAGSDEQNFRKIDLVSLILDRLPETNVEFVEQLEDPRDYRVSFERIRTELGFRPRRTVAQGVDEILSLLANELLADPYDPRYRN